jgi:hypothetical protein
MRCPRCGGDAHRLLGANFAECTSAVPTSVEQPVADARAPGGFAVVRETRYEACGHRFHLGPVRDQGADRLCRCGTYAIGQCADCGTPVCGMDECSSRVEGSLLCPSHAALRRQEQVARQYERGAPARAAAIAELELRVAVFQDKARMHEADRARLRVHLRSQGDENAEVVTALALTCVVDREQVRCVDPRFLHESFSRYWDSEEAVTASFDRPRPPWDSDSLARWFATRATAAGVPFSTPGGRAM